MRVLRQTSHRPEWRRHRLTPRHTAYLRVAEGCNHACTFCAIPGFRGKFRSKPWQVRHSVFFCSELDR